MEIQTLDINLVGQRFGDGKFDAAILQAGPYSPLGPLQSFNFFYMEYDNPRVTELLRDANAAIEIYDHDRVERIFSELSPIFTADMPVTFLFPYVQTVAAHRRIRGPDSRRMTSPVHYAEYLWIEEEEE